MTWQATVLTIFPEMLPGPLAYSLAGKALRAGLWRLDTLDIRDFATDKHRSVDDAPFGGGPGMVLRVEPIARVLDAILAGAAAGERRGVVLTTPAGRRFEQADAEAFAALDRLILVCGHYEGVDERIVELYGAQELSLGDFVLTGGEIPALAFVDATVRLLEGALTPASLAGESFTAGRLAPPAFTRPAEFRGSEVPEVLLSGDHAKIAAWRREQSRARTASRRPDLGEGLE